MKEQLDPSGVVVVVTMLRMVYLASLLSLGSASLLSTPPPPLDANIEPATTQNNYSFVVTGFQQSIEVEGYQLEQTCSGSLISKNVALCTASCRGMVDVVMVGLHNEHPSAGEVEEFKVLKEIVHPKFDPFTLDYDFVLLELDGYSRYKPALLDDGRRSINSVSKINGISSTTTAENLSVIGWGSSDNDSSSSLSDGKSYELHVTNDVELVPTADCQAEYSNHWISDRMVCYRSDCNSGERGSPIFDSTSSKLVSIVSWGDNNNNNCSNSVQAQYIGVSARVGDIYHWAKSFIEELNDNDTVEYHHSSYNKHLSNPAEGRKGSKSETKSSSTGSSSKSSTKSSSTGSSSKSSGTSGSVSTSNGSSSKSSSGKGSSGKSSSSTAQSTSGTTSKSKGKGGCSSSKSKSSKSKSSTGCSIVPSMSPSTLGPAQPISFPSLIPTMTPAPTDGNPMPSQSPTAVLGTAEPSSIPSSSPSLNGTAKPTASPSAGPTTITPAPVVNATPVPSQSPSNDDTAEPTASPSAGPTQKPSASPSLSIVTPEPSLSPSADPTTPPVPQPSRSPSNVPTISSLTSSAPSESPLDTTLYVPSTLQNSYNNETMFMEFLPEFDNLFISSITESVSFLVDNSFSRRLQTSNGFQLTSAITNITENAGEFCTPTVSGGSCYEVVTEIKVTHYAKYPADGIVTLLSSIAQTFISEYGTYDGTSLTSVEALFINIDVGGVLARLMDAGEQVIFQDVLLDFLRPELLFNADPPIKVKELVLADQSQGNSGNITILSANIQLSGEHLPSMTVIDFQSDTIAAINEESDEISDVLTTSGDDYFGSVAYVSATNIIDPAPAGSSSGLSEFIRSPFAGVIAGAIVIFVVIPGLIHRHIRRQRERRSYRKSANALIGIKSRVAPAGGDNDSKAATHDPTHVSDTSTGIFSFYLRPLTVQPKIDEESPASSSSNVDHMSVSSEGEGLIRKEVKLSSYITGSISDQDAISCVTEEAIAAEDEDRQRIVGASKQLYEKIAALSIRDRTSNAPTKTESDEEEESSP